MIKMDHHIHSVSIMVFMVMCQNLNSSFSSWFC